MNTLPHEYFSLMTQIKNIFSIIIHVENFSFTLYDSVQELYFLKYQNRLENVINAFNENHNCWHFWLIICQ